MTIKGNESCWDMLQRVFDLAATHGGFDPSTVQAQFGSAIVPTGGFDPRGLEMPEPAEQAAETDVEPEPAAGQEPCHI